MTFIPSASFSAGLSVGAPLIHREETWLDCLVGSADIHRRWCHRNGRGRHRRRCRRASRPAPAIAAGDADRRLREVPAGVRGCGGGTARGIPRRAQARRRLGAVRGRPALGQPRCRPGDQRSSRAGLRDPGGFTILFHGRQPTDLEELRPIHTALGEAHLSFVNAARCSLAPSQRRLDRSLGGPSPWRGVESFYTRPDRSLD